MPEEWETYYLMVGSSAAALIGLLFVVITLTDRMRPDMAEIGARVYISPTAFHFGVTFLLSSAAVVTTLPRPAMGLVIVVPAIFGLCYSALSLYRVAARQLPTTPHWTDYFFYGVFPALAYLGLLVGGAGWWMEREPAAFVVAAAAMGLLLVGIRDAWDLATYLARNREG